MIIKKCRFCNTKKIIHLQGKIYCENCEAYFSIKNNQQEYSYVPINENSEKDKTLKNLLCKMCKNIKHSKITCRTFKEYYKNLPFCKDCKFKTELFLKHYFFKYFLLYKRGRRVFGYFKLILYLLFLFTVRKSILFLVIHFYEEYFFNEFTFSVFLKKFLIFGTVFYFKKERIYFLFFMYKLMSLFFKEVYVYEVPVFIDETICEEEITEHLQSLDLGSKKKNINYNKNEVKNIINKKEIKVDRKHDEAMSKEIMKLRIS